MYTLILLLLITVCYTAYHLLVKVSGSQAGLSSPILATIGLQTAALAVSLMYLVVLVRQGTVVALPARVLVLGVAAGGFIGAAEVMYFYLFRGVAGEPGMTASVAIPIIVGGTIILSILTARVFFGDTLTMIQWLGVVLMLLGLLSLVLGVRCE